MKRTVGIPYARAGVDSQGAYVECPICAIQLRSREGQNVYGVHYAEQHDYYAKRNSG